MILPSLFKPIDYHRFQITLNRLREKPFCNRCAHFILLNVLATSHNIYIWLEEICTISPSKIIQLIMPPSLISYARHMFRTPATAFHTSLIAKPNILTILALSL